MAAEENLLDGLLADTWWFGLSARLAEADFLKLARLRADQGFNAIQLVVGVPPEVAPQHPEGCSDVGAAWTLDKQINEDYLQLAKSRISQLNAMGLRVIVYGAWGHQIDWTGIAFMQKWWQRLIDTLDALDVIYCLCGEAGLWVGQADQLLPDLCTDDIVSKAATGEQAFSLQQKIRDVYFWRFRIHQLSRQRLRDWSTILVYVSARTSRPVLLHVNSGQLARELLPDATLLAANTTQTGHRETSRNQLWQIPLSYLENHPEDRFINLEPWYEGIRDQFHAQDQVFAYWVTMLAGSCSYCYGAQGIWNVGDGKFMAHWGTQNFSTAAALTGASLIGQSHRFFLSCWQPRAGEVTVVEKDGRLLSISRQAGSRCISYIPSTELLQDLPAGEYWLPTEGKSTSQIPESGQAVILSSKG